MQTGTYFHDDEEYQLSFDTFDGSLYRIIEKRAHHLHTCRVIDCFSLNVAWLDYLAIVTRITAFWTFAGLRVKVGRLTHTETSLLHNET
jgi:hypothetical protein